jgi:hypothetical protein
MSIKWARTKTEARSWAHVRPTKTATMEAATEVRTAAKSSSTEVASASKSSPAAAVPGRPSGRTQGKQSKANHVKYSFRFHILRSRQPLVTATDRPRDFVMLLKMYQSLPLQSECF